MRKLRHCHPMYTLNTLTAYVRQCCIHCLEFSTSQNSRCCGSFLNALLFPPVNGRFGNQSTRHTVNSSQRKMVWRVDRRVWRRCDELTILFDLAFITFKSFAVVGDFKIAHAAMTCHLVHECATSRVSFKFPRPQITVVTNHPCYDTVTLNQSN